MTTNTTPTVLRLVERSSSLTAPILRGATTAALVTQPRLQLGYDHTSGEYHLAMCAAA
jgi:hypothetical protein